MFRTRDLRIQPPRPYPLGHSQTIGNGIFLDIVDLNFNKSYTESFLFPRKGTHFASTHI